MNKVHHIALRYKDFTFCGKFIDSIYHCFWADSIKVVKSNPDYKGAKFCKSCMKISKLKKIKQLTAEECKKAQCF